MLRMIAFLIQFFFLWKRTSGKNSIVCLCKSKSCKDRFFVFIKGLTLGNLFLCVFYFLPDSNELEFIYFGIFDGHGGREAAVFTRQRLLHNITREKCFYGDDDGVKEAIRRGFIATHYDMLNEVGKLIFKY